jgi:hypothetical protein
LSRYLYITYHRWAGSWDLGRLRRPSWGAACGHLASAGDRTTPRAPGVQTPPDHRCAHVAGTCCPDSFANSICICNWGACLGSYTPFGVPDVVHGRPLPPGVPLAGSLVPLILGHAANGDRGTRLIAISVIVQSRANKISRINWSNDLGACPRNAFAVDCLPRDLRASHPNLRTARHRRKACLRWVGQARLLWWQMEVRRSDGDVWA